MKTSSNEVNSMRNKNYVLEGISYSAIIVGIILSWIGMNLTGKNGWNVLISGYSIMLGCVLFLGSLKLNSNYTKLLSIHNQQPFYKIFWNFIPILLLLVTLLTIIVLLNLFKDKIQSNHLSDYYYTYSKLITFFLTVEIILLIREYLSVGYKSLHEISINTTMMFILLSVLNLGFIFCYIIVLKFYTTQGFTSLF